MNLLIERIKSGFEFIFSSNKRAAAFLVVAAILLAIPVTVNLLGNRQDVRQRASESCTPKPFQCNDPVNFSDPRCAVPTGGWCQTNNSSTPTPSLTRFPYPTPTCTPKPFQCNDPVNFSDPRCAVPTGGWCSITSTSPTPTGQICLQVLTFARNTTTGICQEFPTSCLPSGWVNDQSCSNTQTTCSTCQARGINSICYQILATHEGPFCSAQQDFGSPVAGCEPCPGTILTPTCTPRPVCLDSEPRCLLLEPAGRWCSTSVTPTTAGSPTTIPNCLLHPRGDANCDGKVNTDDFNVWRDEFLKIILSKHSDFNNDGVINTDDFNIWRDGFLGQSNIINVLR